MSALKLYDTWFREIRKLWPTERVTRLRNLTWMLVGMYLSRSVHLQQMAAKLPLEVRLTSIARRFRRFLNNPAFDPRAWYTPCAQSLLAQAAATGPIRLILDASQVGTGHQLLMVALAYRKRALPIAWTWLSGAHGISSVQQQLSLLRYIHTLMPAQAQVQGLGDGEFGRVAVAPQLNCWGWLCLASERGSAGMRLAHRLALAELGGSRDPARPHRLASQIAGNDPAPLSRAGALLLGNGRARFLATDNQLSWSSASSPSLSAEDVDRGNVW